MANRVLRSSIKEANLDTLNISVIGGLNMDLVFETERMPLLGQSMDCLSLAEYHGGKGANTAVALYRVSRPNPNSTGNNTRHKQNQTASSDELAPSEVCVFMNGAIGDDDYGTSLRSKLEDQGIDVSGVQTLESEKSGTCLVVVEIGSGESRNLAYQGANLKWTPIMPNLVESLGGGVKPDLIIAHLGIPREQVEKVLSAAAKKGVDTLLNPSPAVYLLSKTYKSLTHLVMNESEAAELSGHNVEEFGNRQAWETAAKSFLRYGVKNVVITLGVQGAYYATQKGDDGIVPAEKDVKVKDSTGAGDTFVGTYSVEYVRQKQQGEWDIAKAIAVACTASARTIERLGAQESIPWADEIKPPGKDL